MSVFDCHVNRAPIGGRITEIAYKPGTFINADLDKASEDNERSSMIIETTFGPIGVVQIAGLVARRIVSFVREGEMLGVGDRFGLIRFGSRVDVFLPEGVRVLVGSWVQGRGRRNSLSPTSSDPNPRAASRQD